MRPHFLTVLTGHNLPRIRQSREPEPSTINEKTIADFARAASFQAARAAFESAWRDYLPKRSEADFNEWRDHQAWTAEKYRRFDRGERMPPNWRPPSRHADG
jgi:hypothetical protein